MMQPLQNLQQLIDNDRLTDAIELLDRLIEEDGWNDELYTLRGKLHWRMGRHALAQSDFEHALAINPESSASTAVELIKNVFDFYNPDLLNP